MTKGRDEKTGQFLSSGLPEYVGKHVCDWCGVEKDLVPSNFRVLNRGTRFNSISRVCRVCKNSVQNALHQTRKSDPRYVERRKEIQRKHRQGNREKGLLNNYKRVDEKKGMACTLSLDDVKMFVSQPCTYCGDREAVGLDRIDNSLAHTVDNCVSCCVDCNRCKSDRFTLEEMKVIGDTIKLIKRKRNNETD